MVWTTTADFEGTLGANATDGSPTGFGNTFSATAVPIYSDEQASVGTRSAKLIANVGESNWGGYLYKGSPPTAEGGEFWAKVDVYIPSTFNMENGQSSWKLLRTQVRDSGGTLNRGYFGVNVQKAAPHKLRFSNEPTGLGETGDLGNGVPLDTWVSVEQYVKVQSDGTGVIRVWQDGVLVYEQTATANIPNASDLIWDSHLCGTFNIDHPANQHIYIDQATYTDDPASATNVDAAGNALVSTPPVVKQLDTDNYETATIPLEVIAPQAGLTTGTNATNAYYKAYTGQKWVRPIAILGGAPPFFKPTLTDQSNGLPPAGMIIVENIVSAGHPYYTIEWTSPVAGSYPLRIVVSDQDTGTADVTVNWTLTVDTANAVFVDAINGSDGTGTGAIDAPYQTMNPLTTGHSGDFLYMSTGVYVSTDINSVQDGTKIDWTSGMPVVWQALDGASPEMDTDNACMTMGAMDNFYAAGINFSNGPAEGRARHVWMTGATNDSCIFNCIFETPPRPNNINASNNAFWFFAGSGLTPNSHKRITFMGNEIQGTNGHTINMFYTSQRHVIEGNTISNNDINNSNGFYFKGGSTQGGCNLASVRNNVGLTGNTKKFGKIDSYEVMSDIEFCYNNYRAIGGGNFIDLGNGNASGATFGPINVYRNTSNTYYSFLKIRQSVDITGPINVDKNVAITDPLGGGFIDQSGDLTPTVGVNLTATSASTYINESTGEFLTGTVEDTYKGLYGFQIDGAISPTPVPTITTTELTPNENQNVAGNIAATQSPTSYALTGSGADDALFQFVDPADPELTFVTGNFDFESVVTYNIEVTATNPVGTSATQAVVVTVQDLADTGQNEIVLDGQTLWLYDNGGDVWTTTP